MTVLEFLKLPKKEIKNALLAVGCSSHHYFSSRFELKDFCKLLNLERGECETLYVYSYGSYCKLSFRMKYPFVFNDSGRYSSADGDHVELLIEGTTDKSFDIKNPYIDGKTITLYKKKTNFFNDTESYNNVEINVYYKRSGTLCKQLEEIEKKANALKPYIDFVLDAMENGSYIKAYNSINSNPFKEGCVGCFEAGKFSFFVTYCLAAKQRFNIDLSILDCMLLFKYTEEHRDMFKKYSETHKNDDYEFADVLFDTLGTAENMQKAIKEAADKFIISDKTSKNKETYLNAKSELQEGLQNLVQSLCEKYHMHESFFFVQGNVFEPKTFNCDLSKPLERKILF